MIVQLPQAHAQYPDLTAGEPYVVIGIEADDYRILNDLGRPFLYPASLFEVTDPRQPEDWVVEIGDEGERYAYPRPLSDVGFFEDFFDAERGAVKTFWRAVNERLALSAA